MVNRDGRCTVFFFFKILNFGACNPAGICWKIYIMESEWITLKSDIYSKKSKVLHIFTPTATLEEEKSNFSSLSEAITGKFCTEFKEKSPVNVCMEVQQNFYSISEIQIYSSISEI